MTDARADLALAYGSDARGDAELPDLVPIGAPRKLALDATDALREQILAGGLRRGTHLVEAKLAARLGVSRGTIREAFRMLAAEGLVEEAPRRGAFVVTLRGTDVREIYDVRAAIEGRAAALIAGRRDEAALSGLTDAIERIRVASASGDSREVRLMDLAFHEQLCALSGNARLHDIFVRYVPALQTLLGFDVLRYESLADIADEHRALVEAIRSGQPAAAAAAIERHCEEARDKVAEAIDGIAST
ncbi:MAG TPA: GntR family transcriptional regulator [Candidatus Limnocylindrales bacterium]|nr:GntR family transcriptional regulator [Candidatus Limnocylindrales bacterium]